jgi:hypothetical protein
MQWPLLYQRKRAAFGYPSKVLFLTRSPGLQKSARLVTGSEW